MTVPPAGAACCQGIAAQAATAHLGIAERWQRTNVLARPRLEPAARCAIQKVSRPPKDGRPATLDAQTNKKR